MRSSGNKTSSTASSQSQQSTSKTQATGTGAASAKNSAATQPAQLAGPSFIQALAQTQADAQDSADATAAAAPEEVTGNKSKAKTADDSDPSSAASLTFLPQSLVAVMAGTQQSLPNAQVTTAADDSDSSTDGVSLASGSSVQQLVANLTQGTAEELKTATETPGDSRANAAATTTADPSAVSAFQAHMSVGSHIQQTTGTDPTSNKVSAQVGTPAFEDELGGKITWMSSQGVQSASLQLSPEHMGPVEVRISVQDNTATVAFNASHADTRTALEQSLPRLREMLASQGLALTDASVSQQSPRGQAQKQSVAAVGSVGGSGDDSTSSAVTSVAGARLGLVDTYA
jgi:flagellar hook-length control protein FliK